MNLGSLLLFVPLAVGVAWLFYLIFRANLATQPLGKIISYFVGVLIIVLAVGWLIDNFLPTWFNDRLQNTRSSPEWQSVIETSTDIVQDSLNDNDPQLVQPTVQTIIITPLPPGNGNQVIPPGTGQLPTEYIVVSGDTLTKIAERHGTTVDAIMAANGLRSHLIYPGDRLVIPVGK